MRGLRVTANFLSGQLPAEYGNWNAIQQLELGEQGPELCGGAPHSIMHLQASHQEPDVS